MKSQPLPPCIILVALVNDDGDSTEITLSIHMMHSQLCILRVVYNVGALCSCIVILKPAGEALYCCEDGSATLRCVLRGCFRSCGRRCIASSPRSLCCVVVAAAAASWQASSLSGYYDCVVVSLCVCCSSYRAVHASHASNAPVSSA